MKQYITLCNKKGLVCAWGLSIVLIKNQGTKSVPFGQQLAKDIVMTLLRVTVVLQSFATLKSFSSQEEQAVSHNAYLSSDQKEKKNTPNLAKMT